MNNTLFGYVYLRKREAVLRDAYARPEYKDNTHEMRVIALTNVFPENSTQNWRMLLAFHNHTLAVELKYPYKPVSLQRIYDKLVHTVTRTTPINKNIEVIDCGQFIIPLEQSQAFMREIIGIIIDCDDPRKNLTWAELIQEWVINVELNKKTRSRLLRSNKEIMGVDPFATKPANRRYYHGFKPSLKQNNNPDDDFGDNKPLINEEMLVSYSSMDVGAQTTLHESTP